MDHGGRPAQAEDVLAESPTFGGPEILFILLVLLGILAVNAVVVTLGCVWAWRAGKGSRRALVGWIIIGSVETLALVASIPDLISGASRFVVLPLAVIALQVALFLSGRSSAPHSR